MEYFDNYGRLYVEADKRIRMELLRLLSGLSDRDYKFRRSAMRYCVEVWRLEPWQFRLAVLDHLYRAVAIEFSKNTQMIIDTGFPGWNLRR